MIACNYSGKQQLVEHISKEPPKITTERELRLVILCHSLSELLHTMAVKSHRMHEVHEQIINKLLNECTEGHYFLNQVAKHLEMEESASAD